MDESTRDNLDKNVKDESDDSVDQAEPDNVELTPMEKVRRRLSVRASKALFRAIDIVYKTPQNSCPYINKQNVKTIKSVIDVVYYDKYPDICKMDIYSVGDDSNKPAILLIHGGGFSAGGKKYRKAQAQFLALNGFKIFCIDYGLSPDFIFPEPIKQIAAAANHIYDCADEYGIDGNRIFVAGDSAGAYYAAMLATFNCTDILTQKFGIEVKFKIYGALLNCGIYDFDTIMNTKYILNLDDGVFLSFLGMRRSNLGKFKYIDCCMPVDLVNSDYPPTFLIYSDHDILCKGQSDAFIKKLDEVGAYYEFYSARHSVSNHCYSLNWRGEDALVANQLMLSFALRRANDKIKL